MSGWLCCYQDIEGFEAAQNKIELRGSPQCSDGNTYALRLLSEDKIRHLAAVERNLDLLRRGLTKFNTEGADKVLVKALCLNLEQLSVFSAACWMSVGGVLPECCCGLGDILVNVRVIS